MQIFKRVVALLMAIILSQGIFPISVFAEETENIESIENIENALTISTPEEFLTFSQMCRYDAYSDELTVVLANDIDMTGLDFEDIPIFLGDFDGNNYTISGIETNLERDSQGLFRRISQDATVSNLNVTATIKTENVTIGGIAATNYGVIANCSFNGVVSGMDSIGGIAGINYGTILNCTVSGGIFGETNVGGITGDNQGSVLQSTNFAQINTDISEFEFSTQDMLVSNIDPNSDTINITNIGGICGINDGIVQSSTNEGTVGYPHVGYNIGGIAGFHSGYISSCVNTGFVQGRKEVGGIVGQFEPYIDTLYSISKLQNLRYELDDLSDLTSNLADDAKSSNSILSGNLDDLGNVIDVSKDNLDALVTETENMLNENIDSVNEISITVADTLDALDIITDSFDDIIDELSSSFENLENMADDLGEALDELDDMQNVVANVKFDLDNGQNTLKTGINNLKNAASTLSNMSLDLDSIISTVEQAAYYSELGMSQISSAFDSFDDAIDELYEASGVLSDTNEYLQDSVQNLEDAFSDVKEAFDYLDYTNSLVTDLADDLASRDEIVFTKFDENFDETRDEFSQSLTLVQDEFSKINTNTSSSGDLLVDDIDDISSKLSDVFDLILDMMQDVTSFIEDETYKIEDVSTFDTSSITTGKVTNCTNNGTIEGDINVGGIAGAISFELSFDMEDTWLTDRDKTQTISRQGIAVVENSVNSGDVTAKKDSVGGILGYQDFGLVQSCTSYATIESTEGDYVGGIVGQSSGYIRNCFSKTTLLGGQFIGGIAGLGFDIQSCYCLSSVTATKGGIGGIVGDLDQDGILRNNFFVSDTLGGLDGISFKGLAEAISYEELLSVENLPEIFESMTLSFYVDDKLFDTISLDFGDTISSEAFPKVPQKDGYFSQWEQVDTANVTSDIRISNEYFLMFSTISGAKNDDGIATILADGNFNNIDTLMVEQSDTEYTIWVDGENTAITRIRYLAPAENVKIQLEQDGQWIDVDTILDGLYLHIPVNSDGVVHMRVVAVDVNHSPSFLIISGVLAILTVGGIGLHLRKSKKKVAILSTDVE